MLAKAWRVGTEDRSEVAGRAWAAARLEARATLYDLALVPCSLASSVTLPKEAP